MRKVANGSAPGPSGWTGELIKALVGDADCLAGLVALVEDIINGDLDDGARKLLLSSSLIASEKWRSSYCHWGGLLSFGALEKLRACCSHSAGCIIV